MSEQLPFAYDDAAGVPPGWAVAPLGQIADIQSGIAKDSKKGGASYREVPYLRVANVQRGWLDLSEVKTILASEDKIKQTLLLPGDVLFNEGGDRDKLGRGWVWNGEVKGCVHQNHVFRARMSGGILPKYISYYGNSWGRAYFIQAGKQTTNLASINQTMLKGLPIRLAPLAEQRRIVAEIEKQFTRLDDAVATLKRVQANLERARASVLKAAVEGRLVPTEAELARAEGRSYEPASVLLERILEERKRKHDEAQAGAKRKTKYKPPVAPDLDGLAELPEGWTWASVDQVSTVVRNGYSKKPDEQGTTPILRISAVRPCFVDRTDTRWLASPMGDYSDSLAHPGDLLFTRYNGTRSLVGVCGLLRGESPVVHPDKLIRVTLVVPLVEPVFIEKSVNAGASRAHLEQKIRTTAGQSGVSGTDIKTLPVPLPPLTEQARIAREVERRWSVLESLAAAAHRNLTRCERLRQSILKRAFEGKLVPQDPTDEPAAELLARIQSS